MELLEELSTLWMIVSLHSTTNYQKSLLAMRLNQLMMVTQKILILKIILMALMLILDIKI